MSHDSSHDPQPVTSDRVRPQAEHTDHSVRDSVVDGDPKGKPTLDTLWIEQYPTPTGYLPGQLMVNIDTEKYGFHGLLTPAPIQNCHLEISCFVHCGVFRAFES